MKILLIQHRDIIGGTGGTEKMCCFFANSFAERGYEVEIVTMEDAEGAVVFPLDSRVKLTNLFDPRIPQLILKPVIKYKGKNLIKWIYMKYMIEKAKFHNRRVYKKIGEGRDLFEYNLRNRSKVWHGYLTESSPDIIISMFADTVFEITSEKTYDVPIVFSMNINPPFLSEYIQNSYKYLAGCHILLDSYKSFLPNTFNGKVFTIPNPIDRIEEDDIVVHRNDKDRYALINVARLDDNHKQQSLAIKVFSELFERYPKWDLHFWGVGRDEMSLREKIKKIGLEDRIFLNGFTNNPIEKLKKSDIFIFPSRYEGFGLALAEAMSVGLPSIGFEACSGVNELIEHEKNGFLAKDVSDMRSLVEKLMKDPELRNRLGKQANKDMRKYDPKVIADKWDELVNSFFRKDIKLN